MNLKARQCLLIVGRGFFYVLLELMTAGALAKHFAPEIGWSSKELYYIAGLIFLAEYFGWTKDQAVIGLSKRLDWSEELIQNSTLRFL